MPSAKGALLTATEVKPEYKRRSYLYRTHNITTSEVHTLKGLLLVWFNK